MPSSCHDHNAPDWHDRDLARFRRDEARRFPLVSEMEITEKPIMNTNDTELLDWLEKQGGDMEWICRPSQTGRGYRLHTFPKGDFSNGSKTPRDAIAKAMAVEANN